MAMEGRQLTRDQVLSWRESWSQADRDRIAAALDAIDGGAYLAPPSGGYLGAWVNHQMVFTINPGYVAWRLGPYTKELPSELFPSMYANETHEWHELSTFRYYGGGVKNIEAEEKVCPIHGMTLPKTGICDDCA
ncbi:hypothetical protein LWF15_27985 [Kineosporia rhizophila]|uniref:hypothetical protein n=1 Tax=Kineosporia rhizophila TaxID=84633 RepID=UPI001E3CC0B2|nr:hypothetical protein [Kineosporia rhizophila]MCE0539344.1 hypothetical protein [Kineosporia rhizophila]